MLKYIFSSEATMKSQPSTLKLTAYAVLFVLLFVGLLEITFQSSGRLFLLEALGTLGLALFVFVGAVHYRKGWGENLFFVAFLLIIANLFLLRSFTNSLYVVMLLCALIGFILSIPRKHCCKAKTKTCSSDQEPHSVVFDTPVEKKTVNQATSEVKSELKAEKSSKKETEEKAAVSFSPGKYMASTRGNVYHEAKCDWAKKVGKTNRLWFQSKKEAEDKGYKSHSCVN